MWPPWARSPRFGGGGGTATASPSHPSSFFKSPSFKDIHSVLGDDDGGARIDSGSSPCPSSIASSSPTRKPSSPSVFHRVRIATSALSTWRSLPLPSTAPPGTHPSDTRIVLYFTSLRVIRKTFEDCRSVRAILHGFHVVVDERDVSMDARFLTELKGLLRRSRNHQQQQQGAPNHLALPRVFIGGRYMGGADEIRQLNEAGELKKYVAGAPPAPAGDCCERCGGVRFVLCHGCSGSHKRYSDKGKGGFRSCGSCNENGLVRCPECCGDVNERI